MGEHGRRFIMGEAVATEQKTNDLYRWYVLTILVIVYVFNFIDRSILGILLEPIRQDLGVSDTAMGLETPGAACVAHYAVFTQFRPASFAS